jgi:hypothetical protein
MPPWTRGCLKARPRGSFRSSRRDAEGLGWFVQGIRNLKPLRPRILHRLRCVVGGRTPTSSSLHPEAVSAAAAQNYNSGVLVALEGDIEGDIVERSEEDWTDTSSNDRRCVIIGGGCHQRGGGGTSRQAYGQD